MGNVLKTEQRTGPRSRQSPFSLDDFLHEGRALMEAARAKAKQIVVDARADAERAAQKMLRESRETGYQKGYEEGRAAGYEEALASAKAEFEAKHVQLAAACESIFREVDRRKRELMLSAHRDLLVLAVTIGERVTKRIGRVDRETVTDNLLSVIDLVGSATDLVVEVNPVDAATLEQFAPDLVARRGALEHVEVRVNESVDPGGCIVVTHGGQIDATLETQLRRIARELVPDKDAAVDEDAGSGALEGIDG